MQNKTQIGSGDQFDRKDENSFLMSSLTERLIPPDFVFHERKQHTFVEAGGCQSERVFPGTASSPASVSRGPRTTDGSQRSHVLNPVCRWTPVVVLNLAPGGSRESAERPIHHHVDTVIFTVNHMLASWNTFPCDIRAPFKALHKFVV